jgi:hypothetical protein
MQVEDKVVEGVTYEAIKSPHGNCLGCVAWDSSQVNCHRLTTPNCAQDYVWKIKDVTKSEATEEDDWVTIEDGLDGILRCTEDFKQKLLQHPKVIEAYQRLYPPTQKEVTSETQGVKTDTGKPRYTLIPPFALEQVAICLTEGLKTHPAKDNWKLVENGKERFLDSLYRHWNQYQMGEIFDRDNPNVRNLAAIIVNALFVLEFETNPELKGNK